MSYWPEDLKFSVTRLKRQNVMVAGNVCLIEWVYGKTCCSKGYSDKHMLHWIYINLLYLCVQVWLRVCVQYIMNMFSVLFIIKQDHSCAE